MGFTQAKPRYFHKICHELITTARFAGKRGHCARCAVRMRRSPSITAHAHEERQLYGREVSATCLLNMPLPLRDLLYGKHDRLPMHLFIFYAAVTRVTMTKNSVMDLGYVFQVNLNAIVIIIII